MGGVGVRYLVLLEELLEVVGAGGQDAAVSAELDIFDHHGDVAVLALQPLLVQQLQEDALVFIVHVLHRLRHLTTRDTRGGQYRNKNLWEPGTLEVDFN